MRAMVVRDARRGGELTVGYRETGMEALPVIWDDFAAGRVKTKVIIKPNEVAQQKLPAPVRPDR